MIQICNATNKFKKFKNNKKLKEHSFTNLPRETLRSRSNEVAVSQGWRRVNSDTIKYDAKIAYWKFIIGTALTALCIITYNCSNIFI